MSRKSVENFGSFQSSPKGLLFFARVAMPPDGAQRHAKSNAKRCFRNWSAANSGQWLGEKPCLFANGRRQSAGWLFLFGVKKEPKNRHRFEAVDADQGCGPGPGRRPGLRPWTRGVRPPYDGLFTGLGPGEQGIVLIPFPGSDYLPETALGFPARFLNPFLAQAPRA